MALPYHMQKKTATPRWWCLLLIHAVLNLFEKFLYNLWVTCVLKFSEQSMKHTCYKFCSQTFASIIYWNLIDIRNYTVEPKTFK